MVDAGRDWLMHFIVGKQLDSLDKKGIKLFELEEKSSEYRLTEEAEKMLESFDLAKELKSMNQLREGVGIMAEQLKLSGPDREQLVDSMRQYLLANLPKRATSQDREMQREKEIQILYQQDIILEIAKRFASIYKEEGRSYVFSGGSSEVRYAYTDQILKEHEFKYEREMAIAAFHYQFNALSYHSNPKSEIDSLERLIQESVEAGFYNIDIDASTLVDLARRDLDVQQQDNYLMTALMTEYIRKIQPRGKF